jgi:hypothetical protein
MILVISSACELFIQTCSDRHVMQVSRANIMLRRRCSAMQL